MATMGSYESKRAQRQSTWNWYIRPTKRCWRSPKLMGKPNVPSALLSIWHLRSFASYPRSYGDAGGWCVVWNMVACSCRRYSASRHPVLKTVRYQCSSEHLTVSMELGQTFQEPLSRCVYVSQFGIKAPLSSWQQMCNSDRKQDWGRYTFDSYCICLCSQRTRIYEWLLCQSGIVTKAPDLQHLSLSAMRY